MPVQQTTLLNLMHPKQIEALIADHITCEFLQVLSDDNTHYESIVVAEAFNGKSRIQRHRLVYAALGQHMESDIHALSMKLYTPEEYRALNE